jgi:hypothetical protein
MGQLVGFWFLLLGLDDRPTMDFYFPVLLFISDK